MLLLVFPEDPLNKIFNLFLILRIKNEYNSADGKDQYPHRDPPAAERNYVTRS